MVRPVALVCIGIGAALAGMGAAPAAARAAAEGLAPSAVVTMPADVTCLVAINQSSTVAVGMADGHVAVWNGRDAAPAVDLKPHAARVLAVGATADGRDVLSVATDGSLARTRIATGARGTVWRVDLGSSPTRAAVFSTDGTRLVAGDEFGEIRVFDTASGALRHQLRGHRTELQDLAVRPHSALLASAGAEADLRVWDTASGRQTGFIDSDLSIFAVAFSPRDGTLASGGTDRRMTLRDPKTFESVGVFELPAPKMVASLAWSPDGRLMAIGDLDDETLSRGGIQVVDASSRAVVATLETGDIPASRLAFFAQGDRLVAVVGRDLRAWNLAPAR